MSVQIYSPLPHLQIKKSEALKIEADVKINCSITAETVYSWSIHNQTSQNITFDLTDGDRPVFRDPILYFSTRVLPYGDYFVELEVNDLCLQFRLFVDRGQ